MGSVNAGTASEANTLRMLLAVLGAMGRIFRRSHQRITNGAGEVMAFNFWDYKGILLIHNKDKGASTPTQCGWGAAEYRDHPSPTSETDDLSRSLRLGGLII
ncbi:hypothetical protein EVAR_59384_1 [Eumeta japonica]|uniref:Uncharacterized protein n=1 Tax=Eumeta variegata TaxID=151549 RepID=A0A4C1YLJ2_EUMVA|nr:hypothetical protein EVAR_59384_1 [Eumeta japonica]